jgi:hypothetical protein
MNPLSWDGAGIVQEPRELKGGKENKTWAYAMKLVAMGGTYECSTRDLSLFGQMQKYDGQPVKCAGRFEQFNGQLKLVLVSVVPLQAGNKAA